MTDRAMERARTRQTVLRIIRETPWMSAEAIGRRMGDVRAREVRDHIRMLRAEGHEIVIGHGGQGYVLLEMVEPAEARAGLVREHWYRTRAYMIDHATLLRQIGNVTAVQVVQHTLFDCLVPAEAGQAIGDRPVSMRDLAALPIEKRSGVFELLATLLDGIARQPEAFAVERAALADRFGRVFLTRPEADALAEAKKLLATIGV